MLKKDIQYVDFDGKKRKDTLYFNLTEPEIVRLDVKFPGGLEEYVNNLDANTDPQSILNLFEEVIRASYGEKSEDGRYFIKEEKAVDMFYQSAAYSALFMELVSDAEKAATFFTSVITKTTMDE